jgi:flagellar protein FliL
MADEAKTAEQNAETKTEGKSGMSTMKKLFIYGLPAFLVQLVVIYFLTAKFVVPMTVQHTMNTAESASAKHEPERADSEESASDSEAKEEHIYVIKDLIINPAGTNGQRYLLTTIAFNLSTEEAMRDIEKKEMAVRDALNSVLTSKAMEELISVAQRESLRKEIADKVKGLVAHGKLSGVYFSKYVIQ